MSNLGPNPQNHKPWYKRMAKKVGDFLDKKTPLSGLAAGTLVGGIIGIIAMFIGGIIWGGIVLGNWIWASSQSIPLVIGYGIFALSILICACAGLFTSNFR